MRGKYELVILSAAQSEIEEIGEIHMKLVGAGSARGITDLIYTGLERLRDYPLIGKTIEDKELYNKGYRKLICGNYLCFYRLIGKKIYVYHIADGRTEYKRLFCDLPAGK